MIKKKIFLSFFQPSKNHMTSFMMIPFKKVSASLNYHCIYSYFPRGISSVVRRCIDKESGKEYAAKIIDIGAADANDPQAMLEATRQEINILRQVMGHPYISK
jgi:hypothetical protein